MQRFAFILIAALLMLPGCDFIAGLTRKEEPRVQEAYGQLRKAMLAGDFEAVKRLVAKEKLSEFAGADAAANFQLVAAMYPREVTVQSVEVKGQRATLKASGAAEGGTAAGTVEFVKEDGLWKVAKETWAIKIGPAEPAQPAAANVARPADWHRIRGEWQGTETGKGGNWTFSFGDKYRVTARGEAGEWFEGSAVLRWELGKEKDGTMRVPPGAYMFDVDYVQSAWPEYAGQSALGAFSLHFDKQMDYCQGRPGSSVRPKSYTEVNDTIRCFKLEKISKSPGPSAIAAPAADAAPSPPQAAASPAPAAPAAAQPRTEEVPGQAVVAKDGATQTYVLRTGFAYDTRFKDPRRATLHYQPPTADDKSSGLLITLDATQTGAHYADGQAIYDMMFNDKPLAVGAAGANGRVANLQWIAYGGQHFPPKRGTGCAITVTSPYTGTASSVLSGKVARCVIHSAGIDYTLDAVEFTMKGAPTR